MPRARAQGSCPGQGKHSHRKTQRAAWASRASPSRDTTYGQERPGRQEWLVLASVFSSVKWPQQFAPSARGQPGARVSWNRFPRAQPRARVCAFPAHTQTCCQLDMVSLG